MASMLDEINEFVHEKMPKRKVRDIHERRLRRIVGLIISWIALGLVGLPTLATITHNAWFALLIIPWVAVGMALISFGSWYDMKYRVWS